VKPLRLFGGAAALLALSIGATSCNASPYAATVNSKVIKETSLYSTLQSWAANRTYVSAFDSYPGNQTPCSTNPSPCPTNGNPSGQAITVAGDAPGTYNAAWVANILNGMVEAAVIQQDVTATGQTPTPAMLAAARSVNEIAQAGWEQFSPGFRQVLTTQLANQAAITPPSFSAANLLTVYNQYRQYFFTQVCVLQSSAFSLAQAQAAAAGGLANGNSQCYDQAQFEQQAAAFQSAVLGLAVGKVAPPVKTSYGYLVVEVVSRIVQPFTPDVQRVVSVVVADAQGDADPALSSLLTKARVQVNPAYGTWQPPEVVPLTGPPAALVPAVLSDSTASSSSPTP